MGAPMKDKNYDLISVLYHTLQGCQSAGTYLEDAQKDSDKELTDFLREADDHYRTIAEKAKKLLRNRLS
ncbi:MAG: hypothetical protein M0P57_10025 [Syntrophales bacterium]|jgi:hypothetical protein|nr:hypothetical protein [Syntrophales bacterium]